MIILAFPTFSLVQNSKLPYNFPSQTTLHEDSMGGAFLQNSVVKPLFDLSETWIDANSSNCNFKYFKFYKRAQMARLETHH